MVSVLMDASALMSPVEADVRVFEELERLLEDVDCAVPEAVRDELAALSDGGSGEAAVAASVGADLAAERCRTVDHEASYADDALVELADEFDYVVTNDGPLRDRVLDAGTPVIHIRGRNKLAISEP